MPRTTLTGHRLGRRWATASVLIALLLVGCANGAVSPSATSPVVATTPTVAPTSTVATVITTPSLAPIASQPAAAPSPVALKVLSTSSIGLDSKLMLPGFGSVWAIWSGGLDKVSSAGTLAHVATNVYLDLAIGDKDVFALVGGATNELDEIDPTSSKVLRHWALTNGAHSIAVTTDAAYVIHSSYPATIDRIDLAKGSLQSFTVSDVAGAIKGEAIAAGANMIWASGDGTTIYGLDPASLTVSKTAHVATSAASI